MPERVTFMVPGKLATRVIGITIGRVRPPQSGQMLLSVAVNLSITLRDRKSLFAPGSFPATIESVEPGHVFAVLTRRCMFVH
jgi:hypothetical protein